jgi:hypothetical protein
LEEYLIELQKEFPLLVIPEQVKACDVWWSDNKKQMSHPKSAYLNWMKKAMEIKNNHQDNPSLNGAYKAPSNQYKYAEHYDDTRKQNTPT